MHYRATANRISPGREAENAGTEGPGEWADPSRMPLVMVLEEHAAVRGYGAEIYVG